MTKKSKSLANKIIFIVVFIYIFVNILLFTGGILLNKKALYQLEKDKAYLIAKNFAPLISLNLFLNIEEKIKFLTNQILENDGVVKVNIYNKKHQLILTKNKKGNIKAIKTNIPLYQPNTTKKIGELEIYYSTNHFEIFMKKYFIFIFFSFLFVIISTIALYIYIKKLLFPLKKLSYLLKDYDPEVKINIPYKNQDDEIGLISNAIDISNKKTQEYSKSLQDLAKILIDANSNLEKKVQHELQVIREKDKQILQQSRLAQMGEMINMIAHQWRQPLSAISATTNNLNFKLLFDENINKDEILNELELISKYSQHLSNTIDDFRNFFKDNKNKQEINIEKLIDETLHIARVSIENKNIKIHTKFCCNKIISTYTNEVKQVLLNLLKNAQDALIEKNIKNPYIEIGTLCEDNNTIIYVKDNAGGVPFDIMDKIFEPYFSTKLEKDGTGLGLYMSKTIIEDHCKGKLSVSNTKEGAKFVISFNQNNNCDDIELQKESNVTNKQTAS